MSYYVKLLLPDELPSAAREQLANLAIRVAGRFDFQGLDDWQVDLKNSRVLGAETEFHDLTRIGKMNSEMCAYFATKSGAIGFSKLLGSLVEDLEISRPRRQAARDWMKLWRRYYKTQVIREAGRSVAIVPAWKKVPRSGLSVRITPGQAFGTGTHATTQLCLRLLLRFGKDATQVLDFGAGTGVLLIAAQKVSGGSGVAVESDSTALEQARKNARLNRVKKIGFARSLPDRSFDLVFANVLAPVLLKHRTSLHRSVKRGGLIFLSGILANEADGFLEKFISPRFRVEDRLMQGEWAAIALRKL